MKGGASRCELELLPQDKIYGDINRCYHSCSTPANPPRDRYSCVLACLAGFSLWWGCQRGASRRWGVSPAVRGCHIMSWQSSLRLRDATCSHTRAQHLCGERYCKYAKDWMAELDKRSADANAVGGRSNHVLLPVSRLDSQHTRQPKNPSWPACPGGICSTGALK